MKSSDYAICFLLGLDWSDVNIPNSGTKVVGKRRQKEVEKDFKWVLKRVWTSAILQFGLYKAYSP